ncbi:hypothetical protein SSYM_1874 [Serratia symbiotica str. Tucson]|uniref:Uncharacterized protein n=1 Tax=Serratia symbiotica str. Tucson TaxID=914128 RepID=E9CN97_9GAMM|nr:hypothetical protein SSYM_1874 [Serratia symbiotica str. Tucson]
MALNIRQVSFYMTQRNKGLIQEAAAATAGISVRSGRRIEKGQWQQVGDRHWRTRPDGAVIAATRSLPQYKGFSMDMIFEALS